MSHQRIHDQYEISLACGIVTESFGKDPGKICRAMLYHGSRTLRETVQETGLSPSRSQRALLILAQHNVVLVIPESRDEDECQYYTKLGVILERLRYPQYLLFAQEHYRGSHNLLIECLLENGRLDEHQLMAGIASKTESDRIGLKRAIVSSSRQALAQLAEDQLIISVPLFIESNGTSRSNFVTRGQTSVSQNSVPSQTVKKIDDAGRKTEDDIKEGKQNNLWLINCDEFTFRLRRDACAAVFREKVGEPARHLLLQEEVEFNNEAFLLSNKIDTPRKSVHGSSFRDYSGLVQTLPNLKYSTCQSCINNNEAHFHNIKLKHVMSLVRSKEIEAVVRERFGGPACRIFRLLLMKRNLEQKQIAEMAMIPVKDTRELLYKLLKAKYVQIQEVARTSDHAPSRTFYLWRVDLPYVEEQVGREIHHATFNVRARLMFEMSREQETLLLLGKAQHTNDFPLTMKQRDSLIRMKTVAARLECSMMRLNELGLFFNTRADE